MKNSIKNTSDALFALFQGLEDIAWSMAQLDPCLNKSVTREQWIEWGKKVLEDRKNFNGEMPEAYYN